MIKHLFSDMDGTVLNSNGEISEVNISAIKENGFTFYSSIGTLTAKIEKNY